jgi:hypothetical protein
MVESFNLVQRKLVAGCCEMGIEILGSYKGKILDQLRGCYLTKITVPLKRN